MHQKSLSWRDRFSIAGTLSLSILVVSYVFAQIGLSWLIVSDTFAKSYDWANDPFFLAISLIVLFPFTVFLEELIFRSIPYQLFKPKSDRTFWMIGIFTSLMFGWAHSLNGLLPFSGLPTAHVVVGLVFWKYIPTGLKNVFWIHYLYNVFIGIMAFALG